jgi:vacuolar-type H+-ATPase subunit E/Vma4
MSDTGDSVLDLLEQIRRKAPEYLDLLTAKTDAEFEQAFDALLEKAVSHLETNKVKYQSLDEDGLSSVLAIALSMPGLTVSREMHSNRLGGNR